MREELADLLELLHERHPMGTRVDQGPLVDQPPKLTEGQVEVHGAERP